MDEGHGVLEGGDCCRERFDVGDADLRDRLFEGGPGDGGRWEMNRMALLVLSWLGEGRSWCL